MMPGHEDREDVASKGRSARRSARRNDARSRRPGRRATVLPRLPSHRSRNDARSRRPGRPDPAAMSPMAAGHAAMMPGHEDREDVDQRLQGDRDGARRNDARSRRPGRPVAAKVAKGDLMVPQ